MNRRERARILSGRLRTSWSERSLRLTPTAWRLGWIGLGLLAAAINTGNNLLYLLIGLLVATFPVSWVASRANLAALRVELRPPRHARAGSPFTVEVTLRHTGKRLDARGIELRVLSDRGQYGPGWVERVPAGSTTRLLLTGRHEERGVRNIRGVQLATTFPIGFLSRSKLWPRPIELLVLPAESPDGRGRRIVESRPGQGAPVPAVRETSTKA